MEYVEQINISDCVVRNILGTFDLYIFDPKFTRYNINIVRLCIKDSTNTESNILEGYNYKVYIGGAIIYDSKLKSNVHLFSYENIPFTELYNQKLYLCILSISTDIIKQIIDYKIEFIWNEFNFQLADYNFDNNYYEMDWTLNNTTSLTTNLADESKKQDVKLCFMGGLVGVKGNYKYLYFSKNFIDSNTYIYSSDQSNIYQLINLSHIISSDSNTTNFYNSEIDVYDCIRIVDLLVYSDNYFKNKIFPIVSERYKIPIQKLIKLDSNFQYKSINIINSSGFDAISNIYLLCDNLKYNVEKIILNLKTYDWGDNSHTFHIDTFELEFVSNNYGYKVSGLSDFLVIPIVSRFQVNLEIIFSTQEEIIKSNDLDELFPIDFWIKLDRYCLDKEPRINLFNSRIDYSEYPVADLIDYLPENLILSQRYNNV